MANTSGSKPRDETSPGLANDTIIGGSAVPPDDGLDHVTGRMRVPGGMWTGDEQERVLEPDGLTVVFTDHRDITAHSGGVTVVFTDEPDNLAGSGGDSVRAVLGEDHVRGGMWVEGARGALVGPADGPDTLSGALGQSELGEGHVKGNQG